MATLCSRQKRTDYRWKGHFAQSTPSPGKREGPLRSGPSSILGGDVPGRCQPPLTADFSPLPAENFGTRAAGM